MSTKNITITRRVSEKRTIKYDFDENIVLAPRSAEHGIAFTARKIVIHTDVNRSNQHPGDGLTIKLIGVYFGSIQLSTISVQPGDIAPGERVRGNLGYFFDEKSAELIALLINDLLAMNAATNWASIEPTA